LESRAAVDGIADREVPDWNIEQMMTARDALNTLAKLGIGNAGAFGTKDEVDPIKHLLFTAAGWGGMPLKNTYGDLGTVENNDGTPHVVTAKDVPVRAFWSVVVYDAQGFIAENDHEVPFSDSLRNGRYGAYRVIGDGVSIPREAVELTDLPFLSRELFPTPIKLLEL
jgi:hypothetical protein